MDVDIEVLWNTLEKTVAELEAGAGDWEANVQAAQAAIVMLLDFPPEIVFKRLTTSNLPPAAFVSWLIYEALKIEIVDRSRIKALSECWNRDMAAQYGAIMLPGIPRPE